MTTASVTSVEEVPQQRAFDFRPVLLLLAAMIALADHLSKVYVDHHLALGHAHTIVPRLLRVTHVLNTGAAFSFMAESTSPEHVRLGLIAFSLLAILLVVSMLWRSGRELSVSGVALALILGGAIGNLYDRVHLHYVIDFIEVHLGSYHYPDFNFADSAIVIGACLLIIQIFRPEREPAAAIRETQRP